MKNYASESCHGVFPCLHKSSNLWMLSRIYKPYQKIKSYIAWRIENLGWHALIGHRARNQRECVDSAAADQNVLELQPGELVEVKPIGDILATLNHNRRCNGLLWMSGMRKFCGRRYKVHKRVERIILEANGELRKMRNTVLLEDAMCDGKDFGNCDRSCFHFWREAWLRRVPGRQKVIAECTQIEKDSEIHNSSH